MNKKFGFVIVLVLLSLTMLGAMPYLCLGNINIPDAYVLPNKMVDFGYVNYFVSDGHVYGDADYDAYDYGGYLRFGILDRAELAVVYTNTADVFGELKLQIISETESIPALSVGVSNLFSSVDDFELDDPTLDYEFTDPSDYIKNSPYIVVSKSLVLITGIPRIDYLETSFHGGVGVRKYLAKGETMKNMSGIFGGIDVKPSKYWGMDLEMDAHNINIGINAFYKNFSLRCGLYELEDYLGAKDGGGSKKVAINLNYTLDSFSDIKVTEDRKKTKSADSLHNVSPTGTQEGKNALKEELEQIRQRRKQAEKELDEIRELLQGQ